MIRWRDQERTGGRYLSEDDAGNTVIMLRELEKMQNELLKRPSLLARIADHAKELWRVLFSDDDLL